MKKITTAILSMAFTFTMCGLPGCSDSENDVETVQPNDSVANDPNLMPGTGGGYLFLHMTNADYGRLFYSVSRDGISWTTLNGGEMISRFYNGHPGVCRGGDGKWYMISMSSTEQPYYPVLWYTDDLITWKHRDLPSSMQDLSDYKENGHPWSTEHGWYGAPKMFYDEASGQYMITWHAGRSDVTLWTDEYYHSNRMFYTLTRDFQTFTKPQRLFHFEGHESLPTIDAIIIKSGSTYYAVYKHDTWFDDVWAGQDGLDRNCLHIAHSSSLTGPYVTGNKIYETSEYLEAPTVVPSPDGKRWYLYAEAYVSAGKPYRMFSAPSLDTPLWTPVTINPPKARHGNMLRLDENTYMNVVRAFE